MGKRSFDLVIAGAGPAGSLAAYTAARAGLEVLLLEREAFPRPKPCGGLLSGKALASLPWPLPEEIWECPIRGVSLVNNRGEALYFRQEKAFAVTVRRELPGPVSFGKGPRCRSQIFGQHPPDGPLPKGGRPYRSHAPGKF
ncbi:MAG: NAD(P)/FAD-dependent oxidoreductase [bacterium]